MRKPDELAVVVGATGAFGNAMVDRLAAAGCMDDGVAFTVQDGLDQAALGWIVIDHQNGLGHVNTP